MGVNWKNPPKGLDEPGVELEGTILRASEVVEHRDTGTFDPAAVAPTHHQSWIRTWWDDMDLLADPTGEGKLTDVFFEPFGKRYKIGNKRFHTLTQAAEAMKKPVTLVRTLYKRKRFDKLEQWLNESLE